MPRVSDEYRDAQKQLILDAAIRCFARDGIHRASMQDIFAEAGLSAGAVYRYFDGKGKIISAIAEQRRDGEAALLQAAFTPGKLPADALSELLTGLLEWLRQPSEQQARRVGIQVWAEALWNEDVRQIVLQASRQRAALTRSINEQQHLGLLPEHLDADHVARVFLAIVQGIIVQQAWEPGLNVLAFAPVLEHLVHSFFESSSCS